MSRKIICDRCGKAITDQKLLGFVGISRRDPETGELMEENPLQDMDFCDNCMDAIRSFITGKPRRKLEPDPEPKPEPVVTPEEVAELAAKLEPAEKKKNSRSLRRIRSRQAQRMSTPGSSWHCAEPGGRCRRSRTR